MHKRQVVDYQTLQLDSLLAEVSIDAVKDAACYFPLGNGRYEVKAGLMPFGSNLGNDHSDKQVF